MLGERTIRELFRRYKNHFIMTIIMFIVDNVDHCPYINMVGYIMACILYLNLNVRLVRFKKVSYLVCLAFAVKCYIAKIMNMNPLIARN